MSRLSILGVVVPVPRKAPLLSVALARVITVLAGTLMLSVLTIGVLIWLALKRRWRTALVVGLTIASAQGLTPLVKLHFARLRPIAIDHLNRLLGIRTRFATSASLGVIAAT